VCEAALFRLKESVHVNAPIERCFLLSTSIELVRQTLHMNPVAGKTSGLIGDNDQLLWRGWKFGIPAMHETLITGYTRPTFFQDTMGRGYFRHFQHDHHFHFIDGQTTMWDIVRFSLPFGIAGQLVGKKIVVPHVLALMESRFALIKRLAESGDWQHYIPNPADIAIAEGPTRENSIQSA
jgi:ligand-binding SRPBCC domain-containing protein